MKLVKTAQQIGGQGLGCRVIHVQTSPESTWYFNTLSNPQPTDSMYEPAVSYEESLTTLSHWQRHFCEIWRFPYRAKCLDPTGSARQECLRCVQVRGPRMLVRVRFSFYAGCRSPKPQRASVFTPEVSKNERVRFAQPWQGNSMTLCIAISSAQQLNVHVLICMVNAQI